eukprot:TRINITY_DN412_c0_g1_i1.p1 TRINITY_DN412_c0_g1~~TRINITY_DN412_c0_g1_i1.p1  ORF type:complete len:101 (-),score=20.34 TRINITY_DN412_c0_g1_i1:401-703(-)
MTDTPLLFMSQAWRVKGSKDVIDKRHVVYEEYQKVVEKYEWNVDEDNPTKVPIIPLIHGTDAEVGWSIAKKGFASLATLDAGYYGKGIYLCFVCPSLLRQ